MRPEVESVSGRLSLRSPQRESLKRLARVAEIAPPTKDADLAAALDLVRREFPTVTDFEREFVSICFALATGVGKTRLMGAFVSYLYLAHGLSNFFVLAPNLTIYNKLIVDFTPNTSKYVFRGISEFSVSPPLITTGETYRRHLASGRSLFPVTINIFNISKINAEVRGSRGPQIRGFREEIGESYFDYLAGLKDLVLIMDESHRYRASAGVRAINDLKPVLGLELTATPFVEASPSPIRFKNIVYDYPLARAIEDGFVKEPAVVTRKDFDPSGMAPSALERIKLEDGIALHEAAKVDLETYAQQTGNRLVKPFLLVVARDTTHARTLVELIGSEEFLEGRYAGKVIQVDSSTSGAEKDETIQRLLQVEDQAEPTEIVVHVNMLKEGWDVTNLYTIVPLRAANARTLIEQSIGRGLRLPYGIRTGVAAIDRLNIVAHDRFKEIVEEANNPKSPLQLKQVILDPDALHQQTVTVLAQPKVAVLLGIPAPGEPAPRASLPSAASEFSSEEAPVARIAFDAIHRLEREPDRYPNADVFQQPEAQAEILREVQSKYRSEQLDLDEPLDVSAIVARTADVVARNTISIPRILIVPKGEVKAGFRPFTLDLSALQYPRPSDEMWVQYLRTGRSEVVGGIRGRQEENRPEDYVVNGLLDFDDIAYEEHSALLYDLANQVVEHLRGTHADAKDVSRILRMHQRPIADLVHTQMQKHAWQDDAVEYEVRISRGFTILRPSAYSAIVGSERRDVRETLPDLRNISQYVFSGFSRCLYDVQKFHSNTERDLAIILDRDSARWFRPIPRQFQIRYRLDGKDREYVPDFVAEGSDGIFILETKAVNQMTDPEVMAKRDAAVAWCRHASDHATKHAGKPWDYAVIPHTAVALNATLSGLVAQFRCG